MNPWLDHTWLDIAATARLRQRERDRTDGHKQKQVKRASNKMRFDGGINLLFHLVLSLVRILIFPVQNYILGAGHSFGQKRGEMSRPFS